VQLCEGRGGSGVGAEGGAEDVAVLGGKGRGEKGGEENMSFWCSLSIFQAFISWFVMLLFCSPIVLLG
jgi:hypothetical protein